MTAVILALRRISLRSDLFPVPMEHQGFAVVGSSVQPQKSVKGRMICNQKSAASSSFVGGISCGNLAAVRSDKFVAGAGNGDDQFGPLRIFFELLSQAGNMSINSSCE